VKPKATTFWGGFWEGFTLPAQRHQPARVRIAAAIAWVLAIPAAWLFAEIVLR
jgi:hypothetical protein